MYLAWTWLFILTTLMWVCICSFDIYIQKYSTKDSTLIETQLDWNASYASMSTLLSESQDYGHITVKETAFQWPMFLAGALAVTLCRNMKYLFFYVKIFSSSFQIRLCTNVFLLMQEQWRTVTRLPFLKKEYLKIAALSICDTTSRGLKILWALLIKFVKIKLIGHKKTISASGNEVGSKHQPLKATNGGDFRLEVLARSRLTQHIEDIKRSLQDNRSRYLHFHELYLRTHEENITLRAQVRNLSTEKEETQTYLRDLVYKIYQSKNASLIKMCKKHANGGAGKCEGEGPGSHDRDVGVPEGPLQTRGTLDPGTLEPCEHTHQTCNQHVKGEIIYTLKNKDGFIEKVYDIQANCGGGETIRRIRAYSVHCDQELLQNCIARPDKGSPISGVIPLPAQHFLTSSPAFRTFMESNRFPPPPRLAPPPPRRAPASPRTRLV